MYTELVVEQANIINSQSDYTLA